MRSSERDHKSMALNPLRAAWGYLRGDDLPRMAGVDLKAATLAAPQPRRRGFYLGDPVAGGAWIDTDSSGGWWRGNGTVDYRRMVGDGLDNSIVMPCMRAICEAVQEPPVRLYQPDAEGELQKQDERAEVVRRLRKPNPFMRWRHVIKYIALCEHWTGNAYLWKARSGVGRPVELWPLAPGQVEPVAGASTREWIRHYAYRPDDQHEAIELPVEDVIHFKLDIDPRNPRKGASPLRPLLAQLFSDQEATEFTNAMLRNFAAPGIVLTPDAQAAASGPSLDDAATERIKQTYKQKFSGSQRGEPMVMRAPWKVNVVSFNPEQMLLDKLQRLPESRVCAALGVPPIVALLYVGLENATYSNAEQFQAAFVENKMVPYWSLLDEELTDGLIPEFYGEDSDYLLKHDLSDVRALSEDEDQKAKRLEGLFRAGGLTLNTLQRELGYPELDGAEGDVFFVPNTVTPTAPADLLAAPELAPAPPQATITAVPPGQPAQGQLPPPTPTPTPAPATRSIKAAADVVPRLLRLRSRLTKEAERDLSRFLSRQARRTVSRLGPLPSAKVTRELAPDVNVLLPADLEAKALSDVLAVYYLRALQGAQQVTEDALGITFELDDPVTRRYLDEAGGEIAGITDTTRQAVREALSEGQRVGESVAQLARRLEALPAFGTARAAVIARTELASATNRAATVSYRASGVVVGVEIFDQESDAECQGWNGRKLTLDEAERTPLLVHPNCTQARAPMVDAAAMAPST
jgi:HK97 family phage portal protein